MENKEHTEQAELTACRYIAQRETGPWCERDAAELDQWIAESPLHRVVYYRLNAAWHEAGRLKVLGVGSAHGAVRSSQTNWRRRVGSMALRAIAATVVLAIGAGLYVFRDSLFSLDTYRTDVGGLQTVPLADGSRVTLNTDSALRISLNEAERQVDLERGEAFFEVARDPARPFVVKAGNERVVAVGTKFSVRRDSHGLRVIVTEGAVRMERKGYAATAEPGAIAASEGKARLARRHEAAVLLPAGAIALAHTTDLVVEQRPLVQAEQQLSWRTGVLTFRDTSLADAVAEFNRYNERKIIIRDPAIAGFHVGGVFGVTQPEPFVRLLQDGFPIRVTEEAGKIILSPK